MSHGLLNLTKHKKCMYNEHRRLYLQTDNLLGFAWLRAGGGGRKERKRSQESTMAPACGHHSAFSVRAVSVPVWPKNVTGNIWYVDMDESITNMPGWGWWGSR